MGNLSKRDQVSQVRYQKANQEWARITVSYL
jgi:hypothetical protein